jgi:hypothetical protein
VAAALVVMTLQMPVLR